MSKSPEKIALVTGASRGLGAALVEELSSRGYHVIAMARTVGALEELDDRVQHSGDQITITPVDITNEDAIRQICRSIHDRWGHIDFWAHAAVHGPPLCPLPHMDEKDLDKTLAINVRATARLIANLEPLLKAADNGAALFFHDPVEVQKFHGAYGLSKSAQIRMAKSWQDEAKEIGPQILIETPAPMPTATRARFYPGEDRASLTPCKDEAKRILNNVL
jgi:NAD(P)-dependent dehydrogenase (short-subunit alcohol dehydrogenase family)